MTYFLTAGPSFQNWSLLAKYMKKKEELVSEKGIYIYAFTSKIAESFG